MLKTLFSKICYKLFSFGFSLFLSISGPAHMPSTEAPIKPASDDAELVFAAIADPQICNYNYKRYASFTASAADLKSADGLDAMLVAGDLAENGLYEEYQLLYENLGGMDLRYIFCVGNHDIRLKYYKATVEKFNMVTNTFNGDSDAVSLYHAETVKGYRFVVLGTDKTVFEESYLSDEQLGKLEDELKAQNGKPTFVMVHQPPMNTHGLPEVWNSPFNNAGSIGKQSGALQEILRKYKNVVLITGHEHTGFGEYTYENGDGYESVNLPSFSVSNANGEVNDTGLGFIVEVYADKILFRARNMNKGIWLPEYDISIPVKE